MIFVILTWLWIDDCMLLVTNIDDTGMIWFEYYCLLYILREWTFSTNLHFEQRGLHFQMVFLWNHFSYKITFVQHFQSLILSVSKRLKGRKFIFSTSRWFYSIFISLVNSIFVSWFQRMYLLKPFELWVFDWFKYFFSKDDFIIGFLFSNFILREHETFVTTTKLYFLPNEFSKHISL